MGESKEGEEKSEEMKPWEQHSAVISIPRYDYDAPISLLHHSHTGFLVTCPIKREKSATKEAMSIFEKCIFSSNSLNSTSLETSDGKITAKRRKMHAEETEDLSSSLKSNSAADNSNDSETASKLSVDSCLSSSKLDTYVERDNPLSLVKLTRSGLLLFTFPRGNSPDVVGTLSNVIQSLELKSLQSPLWCHRIFPIQATCTLNKNELQAVVSKLVLLFVNDKGDKLSHPLKFAVGYNRRGVEDTEMKNVKLASSDSDTIELLDRNKCFGVVAEAVKEIVSDSVVDLKCPELSVLVELLPLPRLPRGSLVVAVSVLPHNLVSTKPRLCVKALVSDTMTKSGKKN